MYMIVIHKYPLYSYYLQIFKQNAKSYHESGDFKDVRHGEGVVVIPICRSLHYVQVVFSKKMHTDLEVMLPLVSLYTYLSFTYIPLLF